MTSSYSEPKGYHYSYIVGLLFLYREKVSHILILRFLLYSESARREGRGHVLHSLRLDRQ